MPIRSVLSEEKKLSMAALSQTLPDRLLNSLPIKPLALYARSLHLGRLNGHGAAPLGRPFESGPCPFPSPNGTGFLVASLPTRFTTTDLV
jgi:hypothetical protein